MISIEAKNLDYAQRLLASVPKGVRNAAINAINRTIAKMKTQVTKSIRKNYLVSAKDVKGTLSIKRASGARVQGSITSTGSSPLLTAFRVRVNKRGPIKVQVRKGISAKAVPGLFLGTSHKGYVGAMMRKKIHARYPLKIPYGPSVPKMFGSKNVMAELTPMAEKTLNERFLHEVEYQFSKNN